MPKGTLAAPPLGGHGGEGGFDVVVVVFVSSGAASPLGSEDLSLSSPSPLFFLGGGVVSNPRSKTRSHAGP